MTGILFTGDSITDCGRRTDPSGYLGAGYVRRIGELARVEGTVLELVNTGIGGDRAVDLLARCDHDIIEVRPDVLTILVGINDTWRRYDASEPTSAQEYAQSYDRILTRVRDELDLEQLVLMEPFVVPVTEEQRRWHAEDLDAKISVVRELAAAHGAALIPLDRVFRDASATQSALTTDGVHPSAAGHELIARAWWSAIGPLLRP